MTVLIDSWAWVEYFRGSEAGEKAKKYVEDDEESIVSTINIAEVYRWILRAYDEKVANEKLGIMKKRCFIAPVSEGIAVDAAKIRHETKLGLGDALILATAKSESARVLTGDPDFRDIKDVIYVGD